MYPKLTEQTAVLYRDEHLRRAEVRQLAASVRRTSTRRWMPVGRDLCLHLHLKRRGVGVDDLISA